MFPLEVWYYAKGSRARDELSVVFYRAGGIGAWRIWEPLEGRPR